MAAGVLTMSQEELDRVKLIVQIQERRLTVRAGAAMLSISERQLYRVLKRFHDDGEPGLIHRLRGKSSNRGYPKEMQKTVLDLYWNEYRDYGPTLFAEKLLQYHNIKLDHDTVRRWLNANGGSNVQRKRRPHRSRRERRAGVGEMVQFDGSPHDWFEGRGPACCLLHAIDDASSEAFLRMVPSENAADVMLTLWDYCERFGVPRVLYVDKTGIFRSPRKVLADAGRAMVSLGTELIFANSPQGKGRVERVHRTHQDRLVKAFRKEGISTLADANRFLDETYLPEHNRRFALHDAAVPNVFRPVPKELNLANVFCFQTRRQIHNDYTITLDEKFVQLHAFVDGEPLPPPLQYVVVRFWLKDNSLHLFYNEREISFTLLKAKPKSSRPLPRKAPPASHPWRRTGGKGPKTLLQKQNTKTLDKGRKSYVS
jgi:hypothetical protein